MIILVSWENDHTRSLHTNVQLQCHDIHDIVYGHEVLAHSGNLNENCIGLLLSKVPMYTCTTDY